MQVGFVSNNSQGSWTTLCLLLITIKKILRLYLYPTLFAFSLLIPSLCYSQTRSFSLQDLDHKIGQAIFEKLWVFSPSSTKSSDGLGPLYNARSCKQCHDESKPHTDNFPPSLVVQLSIEPTNIKPENQILTTYLKHYGFIPEPTYGKQIQTFAYPGARSEATITTKEYKQILQFKDGESITLKHVEYQLTQLAYGELHADKKISARVAPRMVGLGLLDQIPAPDIKRLADPHDSNKDGISGKINTVWNPETQTFDLGKFGWKATKASLNHQNLAALSTDIGVSSWLLPEPQGDCTTIQADCVNLARTTETHLRNSTNSDADGEPEASRDMTDLLLAFSQTMGKKNHSAQPKKLTTAQINGRELFSRLGCQHCHQPSFKITQTNESDMITTRKISPYSDLLLHDMGQSLADNRSEFNANGHEWRTSPLWGIASYLAQTKTPHFLHDGRANSVLEAILWHGGEAEKSRQSFMNLKKHQRAQLIEFVESL